MPIDQLNNNDSGLTAREIINALVTASNNLNTSSFVTTSSFNNFTSSYGTGSFTGSFTGSILGTSSYAIIAGTIIDTGSFATTGSNIFIGNQTITGSVNITGSQTIKGAGNGNTTYAQRIYNSDNSSSFDFRDDGHLYIYSILDNSKYIRIIADNNTVADFYTNSDATFFSNNYGQYRFFSNLDNSVLIYTQGSRLDFSVDGIGTPQVTLSGSNGFLGIGTTAPQAPLHVVGNAKFTSSIEITGSLLMESSSIFQFPISQSNILYTGAAYFNPDNNNLYIYNGTAWKSSSFN